MDIVLVLLATSVLAGAAVGFRLKALALVPIALLIALFSATVLHMNGFGPGSGIATIVACLVSYQAALLLFKFSVPASLLIDHWTMSSMANHTQRDGGR